MRGKYKVISDGSELGHKVFDENGNDISSFVTKAVIILETGKLSKLELTLIEFECEIGVESDKVSTDKNINYKAVTK